jgi:hypothetical protein
MPRTPFRTPVEDFIVTPGDVVRGEDQAAGSDVLVRGGNSTGGGNPGGDLSLTGGTGNMAGGGGTILVMGGVAGATGVGGGVTLQGSDAGMGAGGYVFLTGGAGAGGGERGTIRVTNTALEFIEAVSVPGGVTAGGRGRVWVRDDAPNVLIFTDDTGVDTVLGSGAGGAMTGLPGTIFENLVFYVDAADRSSFEVGTTTVTDLQGNGTGGTLTGTTYDDGGWRFAGVTGDLTFTKGAALDNIFAGGGTVVVIARPRGAGEVSAGFLVSSVNAAINLGWRINVRDLSVNRVGVEFEQTFTGANGVWRTFNQTSRTEPLPLSGFTGVPPWAIGSTMAIAVVYDSGAVANDPTLYINGQPWTTTLGLQETTTPTGAADTDAGNDLTIGNEPGDTRTWNGEIHAVLMFDRALSAEEVCQVQNVFASRCGIGAIGRGTDQTTLYGQDVFVRAGRASGTDSEARGGYVSITGGDQAGVSFAPGGSVLLRGGHKIGTANAAGGDLILASGDGAIQSQVQLYCGALTSGNTGSFDSVFIHGGDVFGTNTGVPGGVYVRGGNAVPTASNRGGGDASIEGGLGDATPGGDVFIRSGGQVSPNTAGSTGDITISTQRTALGGMVATGGTDTDTGDISILTTGLGATADIAGDITITAGSTAAVTGNDPGAITITAGSMSSTTQSLVGGRPVTITAGNSSGDATSPGGNIILNAGNQVNPGAEAGSPGGSVVLSAGTSVKSNATSGGGAFTATAGNTTGAVSSGGAVTITGGNNTAAAGTGDGGDVTINAGDATGVGSTGDGGDIILNPGTTVGGTAGEVFVNGKLNVSGGIDPTYLGLNEQVTQPFTALPGIGYLWVRSDAPTTLLYTDDNNEAWIISGVANTSSVRSTTGFVGTESERRTFAVQVTAPSGGGFTTITTLGTLSAAGRNMKFDVRVTGQDSVTSSNFVGVLINQDAWRDTTSTNLATAHASSEQGNGATFLSDIAFSLTTSGNDIILRVQNTSSTTTYVINVAVMWTRQQGGLSS